VQTVLTLRTRSLQKASGPYMCNNASGDLRWVITQRRHDAQSERARQDMPLWKPGLIVAALPLTLLFAYGFVRFMPELVFPIAATRH